MTTVAFIGLGIMGGPMAANLVKAGFEVTGYNRSGPGAGVGPAAAGPTPTTETRSGADVHRIGASALLQRVRAIRSTN
jgi:2-hydroxy-3-oxopropionate reductase